MAKFKIVAEGDGFYTIKDVPVFEMHTDRGFPCDVAWMKTAITNHNHYKQQGYRPTIIIGHNVKGQEKESVGFLDTLVLKGKRLYADLVRVPKEIKEKIVRNSYPSRSVEVLPSSKRILTLALLGGTTPHFALPQMAYEESTEETRLWFRSPEMALEKEMKEEIYALVGAAVAEALGNDAPEEYDDDGDIVYVHPETGEEYAVPAALAKVIAAGGKAIGAAGRGARVAAGSVRSGASAVSGGVSRGGRAVGRGASAAGGKAKGMAGQAVAGVKGAGGFVKKHPKGTAAVLGGFVAGRASKGSQNNSLSGYSIDDETGEVFYDGQPLGMIVTYEELQTEGMTVPTAVKDPSALPSISAVDPQLAIDESAVGEMSGDDTGAQTAPGEITGDALQLLDRDESDQFAAELQAEVYDLRQRVTRSETANALLSEGRRAEEYTQWLTEKRQAGTPVGDIDKTVAFMMSLSHEQVEDHKALLLSQPKVAFARAEEIVDFSLTANADGIKQDYAAHKEAYQAMGVSEADLKWAPYCRTNRAVGEIQTR